MAFSIDGFGTDEQAKRLSFAGNFFCDGCGKEREFHVCEIKHRITALYIPLYTLSKRYAVLCRNCERGYKLTEQQMHTAMAGDLRYARELVETRGEADQSEFESSEQAAIIMPLDASCFCAACGAKASKGMTFCCDCGIPLQSVPGIKLCPACGYENEPDMSYCIMDGTKLEEVVR